MGYGDRFGYKLENSIRAPSGGNEEQVRGAGIELFIIVREKERESSDLIRNQPELFPS